MRIFILLCIVLHILSKVQTEHTADKWLTSVVISDRQDTVMVLEEWKDVVANSATICAIGLYCLDLSLLAQVFPLGADFKINITTKQESHQEYCYFLLNKFVWTNRKGGTKYSSYFLLVEIKFFIKKTITFLMKFGWVIVGQ